MSAAPSLRIRVRPHHPLPTGPFLLPVPATTQGNPTSVDHVARTINRTLERQSSSHLSKNKGSYRELALYFDGYRLLDDEYAVHDILRDLDVVDVYSSSHLPRPPRQEDGRHSVKKGRKRARYSSESSSEFSSHSESISEDSDQSSRERRPRKAQKRSAQSLVKDTTPGNPQSKGKGRQQSESDDVLAEAQRIALLIKSEIGGKSNGADDSDVEEDDEDEEDGEGDADDHLARPSQSQPEDDDDFPRPPPTLGNHPSRPRVPDSSNRWMTLPSLPFGPSGGSGGPAAAMAAFEAAAKRRRQESAKATVSSSQTTGALRQAASTASQPTTPQAPLAQSHLQRPSSAQKPAVTNSDSDDDISSTSSSAPSTTSSSTSSDASSSSSASSTSNGSQSAARPSSLVKSTPRQEPQPSRPQTPPGGWIPPGQGSARTKRNNQRRRAKQQEKRRLQNEQALTGASTISTLTSTDEPTATRAPILSRSSRASSSASSSPSASSSAPSTSSASPSSSPSESGEEEGLNDSESEKHSPEFLGWALDTEPTQPLIPYMGPPPPYRSTATSVALDENAKKVQQLQQQVQSISVKEQLSAREKELAELRDKIRRAEEARKAAVALPPGGGAFDFSFAPPTTAFVPVEASVSKSQRQEVVPEANHSTLPDGRIARKRIALSSPGNTRVAVPAPKSVSTASASPRLVASMAQTEGPLTPSAPLGTKRRKGPGPPPNPSQRPLSSLPSNVVLSSIDCAAWYNLASSSDLIRSRQEYDWTPAPLRERTEQILSQYRADAVQADGHEDEEEDEADRAYRLMQARVKEDLRREKEAEAAAEAKDSSVVGSMAPVNPRTEVQAGESAVLPLEFGTAHGRAKQAGLHPELRARVQASKRAASVKSGSIAEKPSTSSVEVVIPPTTTETSGGVVDPLHVSTHLEQSAAPVTSGVAVQDKGLDTSPAQNTRAQHQKQSEKSQKKRAWVDYDRPQRANTKSAKGSTPLSPEQVELSLPAQTVAMANGNDNIDLDYGEPDEEEAAVTSVRRSTRVIPARTTTTTTTTTTTAVASRSPAAKQSKVISPSAPLAAGNKTAPAQDPPSPLKSKASAHVKAADPLAEARMKALQSLRRKPPPTT